VKLKQVGDKDKPETEPMNRSALELSPKASLYEVQSGGDMLPDKSNYTLDLDIGVDDPVSDAASVPESDLIEGGRVSSVPDGDLIEEGRVSSVPESDLIEGGRVSSVPDRDLIEEGRESSASDSASIEASHEAPVDQSNEEVSDEAASAPINMKAIEMIRSLQRPGKEDLLTKVVNVYLDRTPEVIAEMQVAADASSAYLGADALSSICKRIENAASNEDLDKLVSLVVSLPGGFDKAAEELTLLTVPKAA